MHQHPIAARRVGDIRAAHYHRTSCNVSLADGLLVACGLELGAAVATSDIHLATIAAREDLQVMVLPGGR